MDPRTVSMLRELARDGGSRVTIRGGCMEPLLAANAEVEVRAQRVYWPGDVIVFRTRTGELAAHRVLGWRAAGVVTKGDHCNEHDAPVKRSDIVGAVAVRIAFRDRLRAVAALTKIIARRLAR